MSYKTYEVRVFDSGRKEWWLNNKRHREDGPAIEYASGGEWFINGKRHREDGPAVKYANGTKYWYLGDRYLTEEEFNEQINPQSYNGTEIIVDGRKYKLVEE